MEKRDPKPSTQGLLSEDDRGLWMKTDSSSVTDHTKNQSIPCGERPQDETSVTSPAPTPITRYYSVMDDEGADDVFIPPPPPSYMAPLQPAEGSTHAMVNNPSVTVPNRAADATEAKANPSGLDWHRGEEQLMAAHNKVDEVKESTTQISKESLDTVSTSEDKDSALPKGQDQISMEGKGGLMETCSDPSARQHADSTTGDKEPNAKPEDTLSGGQEHWRETETDKYQDQVPSSIEENSENETHFSRDKTTSADICGLVETDSKPVQSDLHLQRQVNPAIGLRGDKHSSPLSSRENTGVRRLSL